MKKTGVIAGSLRSGSYNRIVAEYLITQLETDYAMEIIEISDLPLYNPDLDTDLPPEAWTRFRNKIEKMDAVLFVTPEYNRSFPAAIKNALDIGSRPYDKNVWNAKATAVVSVSIGSLGGFGSNNHLRQVLAFLNMFVMPQPEAYIREIEKNLDVNHTISNIRLQSLLNNIAAQFKLWVERF